MKKCFISVITAGVLFLSVQLTGCDKKDDSYSANLVTDYMKLETGKYVIYRLDSTTFINFGQKDTTVSYQAKDVVEGPATDNLGRAGWRIVRYLRPLTSTSESDWRLNITYHVIPSQSNIELNEGNFRYLKLVSPISNGRTWRGNGYLPDNPYKGAYDFSYEQNIYTQDWEFTYQDVGATASYNNKDYDSTLTVVQMADSTNVPITAGIFASKTYWVEQYAKNVGLVYKEVEMWEYQPQAGQTQSYRQGFGLKMTIIDHN